MMCALEEVAGVDPLAVDLTEDPVGNTVVVVGSVRGGVADGTVVGGDRRGREVGTGATVGVVGIDVESGTVAVVVDVGPPPAVVVVTGIVVVVVVVDVDVVEVVDVDVVVVVERVRGPVEPPANPVDGVDAPLGEPAPVPDPPAAPPGAEIDTISPIEMVPVTVVCSVRSPIFTAVSWGCTASTAATVTGFDPRTPHTITPSDPIAITAKIAMPTGNRSRSPVSRLAITRP